MPTASCEAVASLGETRLQGVLRTLEGSGLAVKMYEPSGLRRTLAIGYF
jgi:hypothetical protein